MRMIEVFMKKLSQVKLLRNRQHLRGLGLRFVSCQMPSIYGSSCSNTTCFAKNLDNASFFQSV